MRKQLFLLLLIFIGLGKGFAQDEFVHPELLSFEDGNTLFRSAKGSKLGISDKHYKHGKHSLEWEWDSNGAFITLDKQIKWEPDPKDAPDPSTYTFVFWIYGSKAQPGATLRFEFLKDGKVCSWFDYRLDFIGWRGAWIAFERDMKGKPQADMDELRVTAQNSSKGRVLFDLMILSSLQDLRQHTADTQAPFINEGTDNHWLVNEQCSHYTFDLPLITPTERDKEEMSKVEKKVSDFYMEGAKAHDLSDLRSRASEFGIKKNEDGTLRGKPLFFSRWGETYFSMGHPRNLPVFAKTVANLDDINRLLLQIAQTYRISNNEQERNELKSMFLLLTRYMMDQGFVYGAALGSIHHMGYSMRNFYPAFILMKEDLYAEGLGAEIQRSMEWFSNAAEVKLKPERPGMDIDIFNTTLMARLSAIIMLQDSPEKLTYMRSYMRWLNSGFTPSDGLPKAFKIDGSIFHHCNNYPAYARDGMRGAIEGVYVLSKTDFAVSKASHEQLKKSLLSMRFYCNLRDWPIAMSGRHPRGSEGLAPNQFALLALAGSPDGDSDIDKDLASAYMRLIEDSLNNYTDIFKAYGIEAEKSPTGAQALPYASVLTQRRGNWAATVRGHSRYLWAAESYENANLYGRYLAHGNLQIVSNGNPISNEGSGYKQQGWDWNHFGGISATVLPVAELKSNVLNVDVFSGNEEMLYSDEAFAGPVSIEGRNGAYAMKLHEHDKYNGSLRARKSYFFFDNRIICLGSDIESKIADHRTETTLFQEFIPKEGAEITVDGKITSEFPFDWKKNGNTWLVDAQDNAYFVRNGDVYIRRSHQHSFDQATSQPTENDFTVAAISHGNAPTKGQYEYAILVKPTESELSTWVKSLKSEVNKNYTVVRHDRQAHIVRDVLSKTTGYALFEVGDISPDNLLLSNSIPCMMMIAEKSNSEIVLSLADPDLRFYEGLSDEIYDENGKRIERSIYSRPWIGNESKVSHPRITLAGQWQMIQPSDYCKIISTDKNRTVLEFSCQHGFSREIRLTTTKGSN